MSKKKFSIFNCYVNCKNMMTCKEALEKINGNVDMPVEEFQIIEAKKELYEQIFKGFGNEEEELKEFIATKDLVLDGTDFDQYQNALQKQKANLYSDARNEFAERIRSIDRRSVEGREEHKAIDLKYVLENNYLLSQFKNISNLPVEVDYHCTDDGISIYHKNEMVKICEPIIIKALYKDENEHEYMELEYYDDERKQKKAILFATKGLSNNSYEELIEKGIIIYNPKYFTAYLNMLKMVDKKQQMIPKGNVQMRYGFATKPDGTYDFGRFIGIGEDKLLCLEDEHIALSKVVFNERGTVEGFVDFLGEVSKGSYMIDFQMVVSASLSGLILALINNGSNIVAPPAFIFCGQTSIGKNLLCAIANNIWCTPSVRTSLCCTIGSSIAYYQAFKHFLNQIPVIIEDIQDLIDSEGVAAVTELVFNHSLGHSGGKCTTVGQIRNNKRDWMSPLLAMTEIDVFTENPSICGGADARYAIINLNVKEQDILTERELNTYVTQENENAGVYGKEVIQRIPNHTQKEVMEWYQKNVMELKQKGMAEKNANSFALLLTTFCLLKKENLIPDNWKETPLTADSLVNWVGIKEIISAEEKVYHILSEEAVKDISFVPVDDKYFDGTQKAFDLRCKTAQEVRGRIYYEQRTESGYVKCSKEKRDRTLLLIPKNQLNQALKYIEEENDIKGFAFNQKRWYEKGWLLKPPGKEYQFRGGAFLCPVTRALDPKNRERFYAIVLAENSDSPKEKDYFCDSSKDNYKDDFEDSDSSMEDFQNTKRCIPFDESIPEDEIPEYISEQIEKIINPQFNI